MILHLRGESYRLEVVTNGKDVAISAGRVDLSLQPFPLRASVEDVGIGQGGDIMKA